MKRFLNGKMRMLSLLLSLALAVGLIQANAVTASATTSYTFRYAYDCQRSKPYPKKGGTNAGTWQLTSKGNYTGNPANYPGAYTPLAGIIDNVAGKYGIASTQVEVFELTKLDTTANVYTHIAYGALIVQGSGVAFFIGDTWPATSGGAGYALSNSVLSGTVPVPVAQDVTENVHIHNWTPATSGNGTKQSATVITCSGCGETLTVTLTASDVTLPGDVFTAKLETEAGNTSRARSAQLPLTVSDTPGYMAALRGQDVGVPYLPNLPTPEGPVTEGFRHTMTAAGLL